MRTNNLNRVFIDGNGNVGIGVTSPTSQLIVCDNNALVGSGNAIYNGTIQILNAGGTNITTGGLEFKTSSFQNGFGWRLTAPDLANENVPFIFQSRKNSANWSELVRITNTGAVGIGTTVPSTIAENLLLDVNGSIKVDGIQSHRGRGGTYSSNKINFSWHTDSFFRMWVDTETVKTFVINHPVNQDKYLVHACLEGPENAVFYRGKSQLNDEGFAIVNLPSYFTALVDEDTATVHITPILTNCTILQQQCCTACSLATSEVTNGSFIVKMVGGINVCHQKFYWQVMATRKDVPILNVEPLKSNVEVRGDGPYKYIV